MFDRRKHHHETTPGDTHVVKGAGLARGPALILGTILALAGLALFLHAGDTPTGGFPDGDARGDEILGFESNGWTAFFTTTAGVVLLFAAAQHLLAKLLGLVVGLALAVCVVLDLLNGPGVLGLAAANWAVDLGWGIAAVLLLLNVFAPRIKHEQPAGGTRGRLHERSAAAPGARTTETDRHGHVPLHPEGTGRNTPGGPDRAPEHAGGTDRAGATTERVTGREDAGTSAPGSGPGGASRLD